MARKLFIAGNWKMNLTAARSTALAAEIAAKVQKLDPEFYNWLQSLETAAEILKNKAWVLLSTDQPVINALLGTTPADVGKLKPASSKD